MNEFDPEKHHRRSIRLKGYDYSQPGAYFVTICTQDHECLFGIVENGRMVLNDAGKMIEKWMGVLESKFPDIHCEPYIVMPNHVHLNIHNVGADPCVCPDKTGEQTGQGEHAGSPLPRVVQWFKTMTTNEYIRGVKQNHFPEFSGRLWQRNYYEHIIRNDEKLNRIREHIIYNHEKWEYYRENPKNWNPAPKKN